ncbi:MAG TPA: hypothetical protein PK760_01415, partial [Flavobacteriales bacterium]|nr:hypothetical protein [Flavobacteriales bacterium]
MMERGSPVGVRALSFAVLGFLLLLAWHFYLERMATQDSAFFSWLLIDTHMPFAAHGRIGSWLPQALPLLLIKLQAPLEAILRSYSVSIVFVHVIILWVLAFRLKDERAAIALPIALVAGTHIMFYLAISEV